MLKIYKEMWVFKNDSTIGFLPEHRGQTAKLAGLYPWQCVDFDIARCNDNDN